MYESICCQKLLDLEDALGCSEAEAIGILSILWLWAQDKADESGLLRNINERHIKRELFDKTENKDLDAIVNALFQTGWLDKKKNEIYVHDYGEWQKPWFQRKSRQERDREYQRNKRSNERDEDVDLDQLELFGGEEPKLLEQAVESSNDPPEQQYSPEFEKIWDIYPKHVEKKGAYKAYCARIREGWEADKLLLATKEYADAKKGSSLKYIKHASTFFGPSTPFTDYLPKQEEAVASVENGNPFWQYQGA